MIVGELCRKINYFFCDRKLIVARKILEKVNAWEEKIKQLAEKQIRERVVEIRSEINAGKNVDDFLPEVFAMTREASCRTLQMRHFDVQIIGGYVLHLGAVAEMKTGEGKTLVATLAAALNALKGQGVQVITVNDYLTERDHNLMEPIYRFLGLSSGFITGETAGEERQKIYQKDIVYITNSEAVFDYLRDNTQVDLSHIVQRGHHFAIFDEADFALIDEARSPIILAGAGRQDSQIYRVIDQIVRHLNEKDFEKDEKSRHVMLTSDGSLNVEKILKKGGAIKQEGSLYDVDHAYINHFLAQSLHAHHMQRKNTDYIVKDGQVFIIDEFTGRIMEGRRYSEGLHQAVEAKENLKIQAENQTMASISLQNYARLYKKIAGMTGTAATEAREFREIYNLEVFVIPTNEPLIRIDHNDDIYNTAAEKEQAILNLIKECHEKGQPILVGTISIEKSEKLAKLLKKNKIKHNVLNAKHHEKEAQIIAQAGRIGAVTIATNMAGRGTDIKLGGNLEMMLESWAQKENCKMGSEKFLHKKEQLKEQIAQDEKKVLEAGGLYVIGTERHESRRIDNQLRGRSGRQGNTGESKFFISLDDDLMRLFGSNRMQGILSSLGLKEGEVIHHPLINKSIAKAQKKVESHHYEIRKSLIKFDDVTSKQRKIIFAKRKQIIQNENIEDEFSALCDEVFEKIWSKFVATKDLDELLAQVLKIYNIKTEKTELEGQNQHKIKEKLQDLIKQKIAEKNTLFESKDRIEVKKRIWIMTLDSNWRSHLSQIDYLKKGIHLRSMGQRDPVMEFQRDGFEMFEEMFERTGQDVLHTFLLLEKFSH